MFIYTTLFNKNNFCSSTRR